MDILSIKPGKISVLEVIVTTSVKKFDAFIDGTGWLRDDLQQGPDGARGVLLVNTDDFADSLFVPFYSYLVRLGDDLLVYDKHEINELFVV